MNSFSNKWMEDICLELNKAGLEMPKDRGSGKWSVNRFENSIQLMQEYVTRDAGIYEYLNSKGLINRGYCPITGEPIGTEHLYQIFGRKVYISEKGKQIAKEWDRKEHVRVFGTEPLTDEKRQELYQKFNQEKSKMPLVYWLLIIVIAIYVIKRC